MSKKDKDLFDLFRQNQHKLNERPSGDAWDRLEQRLDRRKIRHRRLLTRNLMMAASVLFLIALTTGITLFLGQQHKNELALAENAKPIVLEDLQKPNGTNEGLYRILEKKTRFEASREKTIEEGSIEKKLIAKTNESIIAKNTAPESTTKRENLAVTEQTEIKTSSESSGTKAVLTEVTAPDPKYTFEAKEEEFDDLKDEYRVGNIDRSSMDVATGAATQDDNIEAPETYALDGVAVAPAAEAPASYGRAQSPADATHYDEELARKEDVVITHTSKADKKAKKEKKKKERQLAKDARELEASESVLADLTNGTVTSLEQFKWLIGRWKGHNQMGQFTTEEWVFEDEYTMQGTGALIINGETTFSENMTIQKIGEDLYYILRLEEDNVEVRFKLVSASDAQAVFENETEETPDQLILLNNNNINFSTILQNKTDNQLDLNKLNYLQNRNAIGSDKVTRNLDKIN